MKKLFMLLVTALFVVSFASMGFAADETKSGVVKAVDSKAGTVTITANDTKKDMTLKADAATLGKFKSGDKVKVTYSGDTASKVVKDRGGKIPVGC